MRTVRLWSRYYPQRLRGLHPRRFPAPEGIKPREARSEFSTDSAWSQRQDLPRALPFQTTWSCSSPGHRALLTDRHRDRCMSWLSTAVILVEQKGWGQAGKSSFLFYMPYTWGVQETLRSRNIAFKPQFFHRYPEWVWTTLVLIFCFLKQEHPEKRAENFQGFFLIQRLATESWFVLLSACTACFSQPTLWGTVSHGDVQLGLVGMTVSLSIRWCALLLCLEPRPI